MTPQEELAALRRLAELEAKAKDSELPPVNRFLNGVGSSVLNATSAVSDVLPKLQQGENLAAEWGKSADENATGFAGEAGKFVGGAAQFAALPGRGIVQGALEAAGLAGATTKGDTADRVKSAIATGALTAAGGAAVPAIKRAYEVVSMPFAGNRNAANLVLKELADRYTVPKDAPSFLRAAPDDFTGPATPKFGYANDIKPTAGMLTDDPALLKLEMNARLRNPEGFYSRDAQNSANVYKTLEKNALSDTEASRLQEALNAKTGPLREQAFDAARQNPTYRDSLLNYATAKADEEGFRASKGVPLINRTKQALILKEDPNGALISEAGPGDIYTLRKELGDSLNMKTLTPDELTNSAKSDRRTTMEIINNIDEALNDSSGGAFSKYLAAHSEGMKPIEQGRSFQDIIDKFETNRKILGTDIPQITPSALRRVAEKESYKNMGKKGFVSTIDDTSRNQLDDAIAAMNAIENAKGGVVAVTGSPTASYSASLLKESLRGVPGGNAASNVLRALNSLGVTRGQNVLDDALLNPEKLQKVLSEANRLKEAPAKEKIANKLLNRMIQGGIYGAQNQQ